jgi:hypothetical protein
MLTALSNERFSTIGLTATKTELGYTSWGYLARYVERCVTLGAAAPDAKDNRPVGFLCPTLPDGVATTINRLVATAIEVDIGKAPEFKFGHHHSFDLVPPRHSVVRPVVPVLALGTPTVPRTPTPPRFPTSSLTNPHGVPPAVPRAPPMPGAAPTGTGGTSAYPPALATSGNPHGAVLLETDDAEETDTPGLVAGGAQWPKVGLLYRISYCLHDTVNLQQMILIFAGMREISRGHLVMRNLILSCADPLHKIRFAPLDPAVEQGMRDRGEITPTQFLMGSSSLGLVRATQPYQDIVLRMYGPAEQQAGVGTIVHETMHAMGFLHTNQRVDRDTFLDVTVPTGTRNSMWMNNCEKHAGTAYFDHGTYDYSSIMHYAPNICGINAARAAPTPAAGSWPPGQAVALSEQDLAGINAVYN